MGTEDNNDDTGAGSSDAGTDDTKKRSFTQEEVNGFLANQKRELSGKFGDYDELKAKADQLDELEAKNKSEVDRANDTAAKATSRAEAAEAKLLRYEVAFDKGLKPGQVKRLVGDTREELEADADDLLADTPPSSNNGDGAKRPPSERPTESLRGGTDPTEEPVELDPRKLAEKVPRL